MTEPGSTVLGTVEQVQSLATGVRAMWSARALGGLPCRLPVRLALTTSPPPFSLLRNSRSRDQRRMTGRQIPTRDRLL